MMSSWLGDNASWIMPLTAILGLVSAVLFRLWQVIHRAKVCTSPPSADRRRRLYRIYKLGRSIGSATVLISFMYGLLWLLGVAGNKHEPPPDPAFVGYSFLVGLALFAIGLAVYFMGSFGEEWFKG